MRAKKPTSGKISQGSQRQVSVDAIDRKILAALQKDAACSLGELAEGVNLSTNACWRRVKALEENGVILRRVAVLDPVKLGFGVTVFVSVRASEHSDDWLTQFAGAITRIPEIVECYRLTGETDYLLKIVASDIEGYDAVYKRLIRSAKLADISASLSMQEVKSAPRVPL